MRGNADLAFVLLSAALVGCGRFTVPGHELSVPGTAAALMVITAGVCFTALYQCKRSRREDAVAVAAVAAAFFGFLAALMTAIVAGKGGPVWPVVYEAVSHLWVGCMLALAVTHWRRALGWSALAALLSLTALETAMFLVRAKP